MADSDFWIRVADVSLLVYFFLLVGVGFWGFRGRLPAALKARYASRVTYLSQLPFTYHWRQAVRTEDLPVFENARVRQHVFLVVIFIGALLIAIYGYVHVVLLLWKCNKQGAGLL